MIVSPKNHLVMLVIAKPTPGRILIFKKVEVWWQNLLVLKFVGLLDGLLGVAGMMTLIASQWIIPSFPALNAPVRQMSH